MFYAPEGSDMLVKRMFFNFFILADFEKTRAGIEKNKQKNAWSSPNMHRHQKKQKDQSMIFTKPAQASKKTKKTKNM